MIELFHWILQIYKLKDNPRRRYVHRDGNLLLSNVGSFRSAFFSTFEHFIYCPTTCVTNYLRNNYQSFVIRRLVVLNFSLRKWGHIGNYYASSKSAICYAFCFYDHSFAEHCKPRTVSRPRYVSQTGKWERAVFLIYDIALFRYRHLSHPIVRSFL